MPVLTQPKSDPFLRNHFLRDASWQAVYDAMRDDPAVHVFGEGCEVKAHYDAPQIERDFSDRIHTLPISEDGNCNFAIGASLVGVKPIIDVISSDFLYRAMDSICNTAAKLDYVRGEQHTIVIRAEFLTGGPTTGQRPEALFTHVPGLRVVVPSTPHDAYGLMRSALGTPGVTLYFEDRMIADNADWTASDKIIGERVPIGEWLCRLQGQRGNVSIFTYGIMRQRVEAILHKWLKEWDKDPYVEPNLAVDLYDLRTLYPVDWHRLLRSPFVLPRTGKLLIIEPDVTYGGIGAEIAARVAEELPHIRVKRLGAPRATIPASASLHRHMLPTDEEVIHAIADW